MKFNLILNLVIGILYTFRWFGFLGPMEAEVEMWGVIVVFISLLSLLLSVPKKEFSLSQKIIIGSLVILNVFPTIAYIILMPLSDHNYEISRFNYYFIAFIHGSLMLYSIYFLINSYKHRSL